MSGWGWGKLEMGMVIGVGSTQGFLSIHKGMGGGQAYNEWSVIESVAHMDCILNSSSALPSGGASVSPTEKFR